MIRGRLELYRESDCGQEELVYSEDNMIVDGAGETIAFMLTIPPDGYSTAPAIYDASNFSIRSLSFGKDPRAYLENLHASAGIPAVGRERAGYVLSSAYWGEVVTSTTSGYNANPYLPEAPSPIDTNLIKFSQGFFSTSDLQYPHMLEGQNINLVPFYGSLPSSLFGVNVSSLPLSSVLAIGSYAYGPSSVTDTTSSLEIQYRYNNGTPSGILVASSIISATALSATYNSYARKVMDPRGFIRRSLSDNTVAQQPNSVMLSTVNLSSNCEIKVRHSIIKENAAFIDLYGGITSMGVWVYDLERMLENNYVPPYNFFSTYVLTAPTDIDLPASVIDITGNIKYKLFAKKVFQTNILKSSDSGSSAGISNYQNLTISWTLYFI
jgi:hypothetical protein